MTQNIKTMKKVVKGNDFTMRIPVRKVVNGEQKAFPLPACTDIAVRLVTAYRRIELPWRITVDDDSVLLASVRADAVGLGTYALEVKGKLFGNAWRSNEYEQLRIVDNNADGDTELDGTDEGEASVEMDTAVVVETELRDAPFATNDRAGVIIVGDGLSTDGAGRVSADVTTEVLHGYVEGREACVKGPGHNAVTTAGCRESHGGDTTKGATGQWSMAEGCMTEASGDHAHAEGYQCVASQTDAHAEGYHSVSSGAGAHAEGKETAASGNFSHAEGTFTRATQANAHAEGTKSVADAEGAHAEGTSSATGLFSHAENNGTATGAFSHAEGRSQATGECSHAEGDGCMTYMPGGGNTPKINGMFCHVEGIGTICCSKGGHAEGNGTVTAGDFAHTEGISTRADGAGAHAEGKGTMVSCDGGHAEGCYNVSHQQFVHMVGVGTESARRNAEFTYYAPTGQTSDKNGYKYMIGVGGYDGVKTDVTQIKSVQEVLTDIAGGAEIKAWATTVFASKEDLPPYISLTNTKGDVRLTTDDVTFTCPASNKKKNFFNVRSFAIVGNGSTQTDISLELNGNGYAMPVKSFKMQNVNINNTLDLSQLNTEVMTDMSNMFLYTWAYNIKGLESLDTSNVTSMNEMFRGSVVRIFVNADNDVMGKWKMDNVTTINGMFSFIQNGGIMFVKFPAMPNLKDAKNIFIFNKKVLFVNMSRVNASKITDLSSAFYGCEYLTTLDLSGIEDWSLVENMSGTFVSCTNLQSLVFNNTFGDMKNSVGTIDLSSCEKLDDATVKRLKTGLFDRKSVGLGVLTLKLHPTVMTKLGEDGIAAITAKGFTVA